MERRCRNPWRDVGVCGQVVLDCHRIVAGEEIPGVDELFETLGQPVGKLPRQVDHELLDSGGAISRGKRVSGGTRPSPSWGRTVL